jgi:hypothetical protein
MFFQQLDFPWKTAKENHFSKVKKYKNLKCDKHRLHQAFMIFLGQPLRPSLVSLSEQVCADHSGTILEVRIEY